MKSHRVEIFSANCPSCRHVMDVIEIGKCKGCTQIIYDVNTMTDEIKKKISDYDIISVPTTVIDGKIKVVGIPDFPWICSDELYKELEKNYTMKGRKT